MRTRPPSTHCQDLFQLITRFRPGRADPPAPLKPFIPEFIPALGGVDEFVKVRAPPRRRGGRGRRGRGGARARAHALHPHVRRAPVRRRRQVPRPDGRPDFLGLRVLDEPAAAQSDAGVLALRLRALGRAAPGAAALDVVGRVDGGGGPRARAKAIDAWVASVAGAPCPPARGLWRASSGSARTQPLQAPACPPRGRQTCTSGAPPRASHTPRGCHPSRSSWRSCRRRSRPR